jgi:hypothetical protein
VNFGTRSGSLPVNDKDLLKLLYQFDDQINRQVRKVARKFGAWITREELYSKAKELLWNYAYRPTGGPNDAGMLYEWESILFDQPDLLYAYVARALYGDLMNWAESVKNWKQETRAHETTLSPLPEVNAESGWLDESPILDYVAHRHSHTEDGVMPDAMSQATYRAYLRVEQGEPMKWGLDGCELIRNGLGPVARHCERCERHLAVRDDWSRKTGIAGPWLHIDYAC